MRNKFDFQKFISRLEQDCLLLDIDIKKYILQQAKLNDRRVTVN